MSDGIIKYNEDYSPTFSTRDLLNNSGLELVPLEILYCELLAAAHTCTF